MKHIAELDGLRGMAALFVLVAHAAFYGFLPPIFSEKLGATGVGVFFVLSGFLMAYLYAGQKPDFETIRSYLINRLSRVLPLFYLVLLGGVALFLLSGQSVYAFTDMGAFLANFFLIRGTGVLWSVPVEIHYYLLFILIWFFGWRYGHVWISLTVLILQTCLLVSFTSPDAELRWIHYYLHLFLAGHLIGLAYRRYNSLVVALDCPILSFVMSFGVAVLFVLLFDEIQAYLRIPFHRGFRDPLVSLFCVLGLVAALARTPFARFLKTGIMRFYGRISYALYLLHIPVILVTYGVFDLEERTSYHLFLPILIICTVLSWATHRWIEVVAQNRIRRVLLKRD